MIKKIFNKIKTFVDIWKIWLFFCVLVGTNAGQQLYYSEPTEKPVEVTEKTTKAVIIHKFDEDLVRKLVKQELDKHKNGSQH